MLLNRAAVKKAAMNLMESMRPALAAQMTRVSNAWLDDLEAHVQSWVRRDVARHPSLGHTFGGPLVSHKSKEQDP